MAVLQDLIKQIDDPQLRERISQEVDKLTKQKKFGLVFEEHMPECTPLYDVPIKRGSKVALKAGKISDIWIMRSVDGDMALCEHRIDHEEKSFLLSDLVAVAEFGEPIYPYLKPIDSVCNEPDSDLWHTLIEADNYHALQLLEYLYAGKVDCIYIDPPYNTGARDWKYNNNYVDSSDQYRHSKWLSFMEKRLKLAKKLLNPSTGVLIVTIDEHEVHHLRTLLEEIMPETYIQMITDVINPKGSTRGRFSRVEEYVIYCFMPDAYVIGGDDPLLGDKPENEKLTPRWKGLLRSGADSRREDSKNLFYPVLIDEQNNRIIKAGQPIPWGITPNYDEKIEGYSVAWPIRNDKSEGRWMLSTDTFNEMLSKGYISLGRYDRKRKTWGISYLSQKYQKEINTGELEIIGKENNGQTVKVRYKKAQAKQVKTVWHRTEHDAGAYGSDLISAVTGRKRLFSFPKSLYSEKDAISMVVRDKKDALIVDFFAGSGTTLHAVNLLNAEDGGHRRCIMVTNNEVSDAEAKSLTKQGYKPGDEEWEKLGIARYVTWPRTVCSIEGHDINGKPLKGKYIGSDIPMADGFKANAIFFKLGFLDKNAVALGKQFKELLPVLWMKAGCIGPCPELGTEESLKMLILPKNKFAVLIDETYFAEFDAKVAKYPEIQTIYIITDSESAYREMIREYEDKNCYQLYRDYLDNFRINVRR
ncbi:site-specific DNA-methyltransferase [Pseudoramibacter sp.]|jgi:adenine-specific DNA-methyltransferase|uniref:site-specific DNA-methyltransferase n=1 Tax=Pseudoramibacter sp. TaxID=2034862 RepID=UPI0025F2E987|nr:DNA methyltransferase [Pseudoramibacter sp.]MCH4071820.1 site-specific DNA-methyltransferase [Pseudoramibacter sp.]MCH4105588.1 site-specific DNA-methyltransferase [Pseudoramibacter sp.]